MPVSLTLSLSTRVLTDVIRRLCMIPFNQYAFSQMECTNCGYSQCHRCYRVTQAWNPLSVCECGLARIPECDEDEEDGCGAIDDDHNTSESDDTDDDDDAYEYEEGSDGQDDDDDYEDSGDDDGDDDGDDCENEDVFEDDDDDEEDNAQFVSKKRE